MKARNTRRTAGRPVAIALAVSVSALSLTACGDDGSDDTAVQKGNDITVGLLLPDRDTARFEKFDYPLIRDEVASLTEKKGKVRYANAEASVSRQSAQFQKMIDDKVDVILVDALNSKKIASDVRKAKDAGIPVIAYDRLAEGPIDAYVSHDNELVGQVQGRAIMSELGEKSQNDKVVMMNGDPGDPNTARFKDGALSELQGQVDIVKQYDTKEWKPSIAKANMEKAIQAYGLNNIAAVYSANDGMAGAVIEAMKEAGATKMPPVTGQDANLDAVQRVVSGEQYMTVYKSFLLEATNAAKIAVAKVQGRQIEFAALTRETVDSPTAKNVPAMLVPVVALTKDNIKETVITDGVYTVKDICTSKYKADCAAIGLE
ncbi:sugar ABC transporter substrate-binding protein [Streptomyces sp. CA-179760]|uniref:sugar ABC transporter substrate-binding protein n=1 Tax=Streptomyces sp. CA-179760 TaxID=3240054 RepID=UPI003D8FB7D6